MFSIQFTELLSFIILINDLHCIFSSKMQLVEKNSSARRPGQQGSLI